MEAIHNFLLDIEQSYLKKHFQKITLSKPQNKDSNLKNVYIRLITLKNTPFFNFTFRYANKDTVKNLDLEQCLAEIQHLVSGQFKIATLFTDTAKVVLTQNKKGNWHILQQKKEPQLKSIEQNHDRTKIKRADTQEDYLFHLGIVDKEKNVIPKMADKFRQINKYLEIIEVQLDQLDSNKKIDIVDMGSGKGYLTFALYHFLTEIKKRDVSVTGIELREDLVDFCNEKAKICGFETLQFICKPIESFNDKIDVLIALHACDTATDDAINKGIKAKAQLIICAPCCHKQIRQQVKGKTIENPILKYGIFKERQFEMVTDTIRALIMEDHHYKTNVFEFISNEHTRKNVMMIGSYQPSAKTETKQKVAEIKEQYHITEHYLEKLLDSNN